MSRIINGVQRLRMWSLDKGAIYKYICLYYQSPPMYLNGALYKNVEDYIERVIIGIRQRHLETLLPC